MRNQVLIVDDEYDLLQAMICLLEDEGYQVVGFSSSQRAIDYLARSPEVPALILLDVMMPVISGLEVLVRLRRAPATRAVPVVLMSAVDPPRLAPQPWNEFLEKPFDVDALLRTVARYAGDPVAVRPPRW